MRMTLALKGQLAQVEVVKPENEITEAWHVSDTRHLVLSLKKAFPIYCQQEEAWFAQYLGADSVWELWHARI
ncbi:unnamed protein product [Peronospora belbahrii]|uniref:Uncharacterized protein n=1 Tax=Peronospora belbahrii TaxID=622444 RepID=A0AAU9LBI2_9STRA|nr:unnamed protein product [Peronospora belbahrii]